MRCVTTTLKNRLLRQRASNDTGFKTTYYNLFLLFRRLEAMNSIPWRTARRVLSRWWGLRLLATSGKQTHTLLFESLKGSGHWGSNALDSYLGCTRFEAWTGHRLICRDYWWYYANVGTACTFTGPRPSPTKSLPILHLVRSQVLTEESTVMTCLLRCCAV
jgi:hypothetical protein